MKYIIFLPLNLICMVLCYFTNFIVTLFCDEVGELHGFLKYWQTWDDSCDVDWFVKTVVPKIFRYDFDSKYFSSRETNDILSRYGRDKGCVVLKDGATFTLKEKIQRYFCRTLWLYRNCSYGFSFYLFGVESSKDRIIIDKDIKEKDYECFSAHDFTTNLWNRPWISFGRHRIIKNLFIEYFIGWKLNYTSGQLCRSMIANRICFRIDK